MVLELELPDIDKHETTRAVAEHPDTLCNRHGRFQRVAGHFHCFLRIHYVDDNRGIDVEKLAAGMEEKNL